MNGIEEMLKRQQVGIKIRNLVVTGEAYQDEKLEELISVAEDNGTTVWEMENGTQIREGKLRFTCLGPKEKNMNPGNEASMILHLEYEGFDMLFTGDVEKEGEESRTDTLSYLQGKEDFMGDIKDCTSWIKEFYNGSISGKCKTKICMDFGRKEESLRTST